MKNLFGSVFSTALLIVVATACNFNYTSANISELKFGKNDRAEPSTKSFNTGEDIYAVAVISNAKGKFKLTWRMSYENVPGKGKGEEIGTNSREFEDSSRLWQTFSTPLTGEYKVEATLQDDKGKTIETRADTVMVTRKSSDKRSDDDDEDN
ncbi:MAG TPA: hypothetical protein PKD26_05235 [Pyrinomonadaceae bacterium]|nr:hypothetical protein [Pyrinomonadaceae bacterium]